MKLTKRITGLRTNAFAALVGLLIAFVLGTTLYGQVPKDAQGRGLFGAFGEVIISGPVLLILHAIVGTLIIVSAATAVIRAILIRNPGFVALMSVAFLAVLLAWFAGSAFANTLAPSAARAMEWSTAVAVLLYAIFLFVCTPQSAKAGEQ
ncbi:hypothetical protein [Subtercola lobariae]|uniref:Uncharacterized protein n=1 Tax=Subtercola lobariae TaxID=1588641 RepID=A0A917EWR8_9MICO|nr:hypothetical protein [Subtercola lobariae]GGF23033.1 hypothetical protein GCM10011399_15800 [Subtercola lobariae]